MLRILIYYLPTTKINGNFSSSNFGIKKKMFLLSELAVFGSIILLTLDQFRIKYKLDPLDRSLFFENSSEHAGYQSLINIDSVA